MESRFARHLGLVVSAWLLAAPAAAITAGQVDDFQDGTLQGWGGGSSPTNQPNGGPAGPGDHYLQLTSGGFRLGTFNTTQWSGDYQAASVSRVSFDLDNLGPDAVSLRIMVLTPGCAFGGTACTAWTSTNPTVLASGSGWVIVEFSLAEADMTRVQGADSLAATLQNVERLLLRHDDGTPDPPGTGPVVDAVLGVDDVTALPEPSVPAGALVGVLALIGLRRVRWPEEEKPSLRTDPTRTRPRAS